MDLGNIKAKVAKQAIKKNVHLHSENHLLADELTKKFNEPKRFGFYLKIASTHNHVFLRKIANEILENPKVNTPGKLFAYLIKKNRLDNETPNNQTPEQNSANQGN